LSGPALICYRYLHNPHTTAMRPIRWKSRYRTGDPEQDRENQGLAQCINTIIEASREKDHCREIEDLLAGMVERAEVAMDTHRPPGEIKGELRTALLENLPLPSHDTAACHRCGFCDLAQEKARESLQERTECLGEALRPRTPK